MKVQHYPDTDSPLFRAECGFGRREAEVATA